MENKNRKQIKLKWLYSTAAMLMLFFIAFEVYLFSHNENIDLFSQQQQTISEKTLPSPQNVTNVIKETFLESHNRETALQQGNSNYSVETPLVSP